MPGPRVLDVPPDLVLPTPGRKVLGDGGRVDVLDEESVDTPHDTAAGDLATAGLALVRRTGGDPGAEGWLLTVDGTTNHHAAVGRGVPPALRDLLLGARTGAALTARPRVRSRRTVHRYLDADGVERGRVVDVTGTVTTAGEAATVRTTRHVEVSGWDGPALDAVVRRLVKAGASERPSPVEADGDDPVLTGGTVGDALTAYLARQRRAVVRADLDLRRGEDAVHRFRVALRRVRSALRVVPVTDADATAAFDAELRWLSGVLGAVRDTDVLRDHLRTTLELARADDPQADLGTAAAHVERTLDTNAAAARAELTRVLAGRRYLAVLRTLRDWSLRPPLTAAADRPEQRLASYVKRANRKLEARLAAAGADAERLHGARKAAKRARYVAYFAGPAAGKHGPAVAARAKALQTSLGEHQDSVVAAAFLRKAARTAAPDAAFGLGVLYAAEQRRGARELARATG